MNNQSEQEKQSEIAILWVQKDETPILLNFRFEV